MKQFSLERMGFKLALLTILVLPELAGAQFFTCNNTGGSAGGSDVLAGFRKTGTHMGSYELVVNLGSITNFLNVSSGTTIAITNFSTTQLTNAFTDTGSFGNLQWSVFSAFQGGLQTGFWTTPLGSFPNDTLWLTLPGTNVNTQTQPPVRNAPGTQANQRALITGCGAGAASMSSNLGVTNVNNNTVLVRETVSDTQNYLTAFIGDVNNIALGDFGANNTPLSYVVENTTPSPFISAQRNDFYQLCPSGKTDPINGSTTTTYFVGYFILNPNGSMTFTRAAAAGAVPVASFRGTPTNGVAPLSVTFTDASTGSITNWIWNLGDGTSVTNASNASVNHTYAAGTYTVSLTVNGTGGSSVATSNNYVVVTNALPVAGFSATPTNIFVTQSVLFTDASSGSITNWIWSFGDGSASVTNISNVSVNHAYAVAGTNTVSLVVNGAGGSSTNTLANYIVVKPKPALGKPVLSGSSMILSGVNGPAGQQYRILSTTNVALPLASWTPVYTNTFNSDGSYGYTNSTLLNKAGFLLLVSP
jgi:PKD repeat protein